VASMKRAEFLDWLRNC